MRISGTTKLVGIFGYPVQHSFSPIIHNTAFSFLGLDYIYVPYCVPPDKLPLAIQALGSLGIKGVNITIPHKEAVIPFLAQISSEAKLIGAVNTIKVDEQNQLIGYNTDGLGFINALLADLNISVTGKSMLILGAGGGARAVSIQSAISGIKQIYIMDIDQQRTQKLVSDIQASNTQVEVNAIEQQQIKSILPLVDILVNATPIGMQPNDPLLITPEWLYPELKVFDLIYNPLETKLVKIAKEHGCSAANGLNMLIQQGAASFEIWTGIKPPVEIMRQAIVEYLSEDNKLRKG
jgi:shikimate dehydrogenase